MLVALCGFMGSGKSTLMNRLKGAEGWDYIDLDREILDRVRYKTISEMLEHRGWDFFRRAEFETLEELLHYYCTSEDADSKRCLLALGGGTLRGDTGQMIKSIQAELGQDENALRIIYLDTPFAICWERICDDQSRPLVKEGRESVEQLYRERETFYRLFSTQSLSPEEQDKILHPRDLLSH